MEIRAIRAREIEEARTLLTQEPGWAARFADTGEFARLISKTLLIVRNGHRGQGIAGAACEP